MLKDVRAWLGPRLEAALSTSKARMELLVAVTEVVSNIIRHGYGGCEDREIRLSLEETDTSVRVIVRDDGAPFDPHSRPSPDVASGEEGGRGVYLLTHYVDALEYTAGPENTLTMTKLR
jgi:anti-sigma regulatory factor (Ser/Thr protein kinase)